MEPADKHSANVVIVGAGVGGSALLETLIHDETTHIIGVVDINPEAPGVAKARNFGIPVSKYADTFINNPDLKIDIILDVTGNPKVLQALRTAKSQDTRMISGIAVKYLWSLIEARNDNRILQQKYHALKASVSGKSGEEIIFGTNPVMQQIRHMIGQVAPTPATVLILGETGTGKEMIAKSIQQQSRLKDKVFIPINCTAFSPQLLESELFGYKKGAFTGAMTDRTGLLESGDEGTIFLDEIGDISLEMQTKLLRFLQFGEIRPVGSTETKKVKTRIIAATNRNLKQLIKEGKFREDLFYRLNTFVIELPPLRERKEDIPVLAYHFLKQAVVNLNKRVSAITPDAMECLNEYDYPGNLRELQSLIERAVILTMDEKITSEQLPQTIRSETKVYNYKQGLMSAKEEVINQFERQALQHFLLEAKGKITEAALLARVPRRTFYRLMEKHDIKKDHYKNNKK